MYYICYETPSGCHHEAVRGRSATTRRVDVLAARHNLRREQIHVFREGDAVK